MTNNFSLDVNQKQNCVSVNALMQLFLLKKAPGQQWWEAVKHTGGQVEYGAEAGLQSGGTTSVDHHHLVDLFWILMGQEGTKRHTREAGQETGYRKDRRK